MSSDQFCLKWNNYQTSMVQALEGLKVGEELVDVTLSCERKSIRAHKIILSACSQYFRDIFKDNPCQHPVVILKDVRYIDLESLVKYMYAGQVYIAQDQLGRFLKTAEALQVKGLAQNPFISSSPEREEERKEETEEKIDSSSDEDEDEGQTEDNEPQVVRVGTEPLSSPQPILGGMSTLPHLLSLPPLSVPGFISKFPTHPTPPPSLSPISLPSPGKIMSSPIKVPTPPNSSLKRPSLSSLAHYLSGVAPVSVSPPLEAKRRKTVPSSSSAKAGGSSLPPSSPPHSTSSSEERNSPDGEADSDTEGLVIEEQADEEHQIPGLVNSVYTDSQHTHISAIDTGKDGREAGGNFSTRITGNPSKHEAIVGLGKPDNTDTQNEGSNLTPTHPRNRWRCMQPRVCNYCWKTFSNSFNLKQHIVNVHVQSQGVTCTVCQKVVKNKWYLRKHLVTAHGAPLKRSKSGNSGAAPALVAAEPDKSKPAAAEKLANDVNQNIYVS